MLEAKISSHRGAWLRFLYDIGRGEVSQCRREVFHGTIVHNYNFAYHERCCSLPFSTKAVILAIAASSPLPPSTIRNCGRRRPRATRSSRT